MISAPALFEVAQALSELCNPVSCEGPATIALAAREVCTAASPPPLFNAILEKRHRRYNML